MNNTFKNLVIFVAGGAVGSAVTWKLLKTKYERIAQEEIDSVKEVFSRREKPLTDEVESKEPDISEETEEESTDENPEMVSYVKKLTNLGYTDYADMSKKDDEPVSSVKPYVISPDEYGCAEGYDMIDLTYYADGVLADETDEIVEDVEGTIGTDSLRRFGEYEHDAVHVRNDVRRIDYEILRVKDTYEATVGQARHQTEEE